MFRYGLVGNTITYGGILAIFGYVGYEIRNIGQISARFPEDIAREVYDPKNLEKLPERQSPDVKSAAAKLYLQEYSRQQYVNKRAQEEGQSLAGAATPSKSVPQPTSKPPSAPQTPDI